MAQSQPVNLAEHFIGLAPSIQTGLRSTSPADIDVAPLRLVVLPVSSGGRLASLGHVLSLRPLVAWAKWRIRASGAREVRVFAFFPDVESPSVVYELDSPAQHYVESHILPAGGGLPASLRWLLAAWAGCDPGIAAVVVAGRTR
jgi:hypothetical protein